MSISTALEIYFILMKLPEINLKTQKKIYIITIVGIFSQCFISQNFSIFVIQLQQSLKLDFMN